VLCACEDCRQALCWASKNGANTPKNILYSVYFRSDFSGFTGVDKMIAIQLRDDTNSTRDFCKNCFSCIAIDHVNYQNNVFMIQPDYSDQNFKTECPPKAVINLIDYPGDIATLESDEIPIFHTTRFTQERKRFLSIYPISEFLAPPKSPATGLTIREIISKMNDIDILNLPKDANP
ncbi:MAG: hypothetical protein QMC11_11225, partial [Rhodospirillales bacterium]